MSSSSSHSHEALGYFHLIISYLAHELLQISTTATPLSTLLRMSKVNMIRIVEFQPKCCRYRSKSSQIHSYSPVSALYSHQSPSCITPASKILSVQNRASPTQRTSNLFPVLLKSHQFSYAHTQVHVQPKLAPPRPFLESEPSHPN